MEESKVIKLQKFRRIQGKYLWKPEELSNAKEI